MFYGITHTAVFFLYFISFAHAYKARNEGSPFTSTPEAR